MLRCKEAARLASKSMDTQLGVRERLGLALHLAMCRHCARYQRQLRQLRELLSRDLRELGEGRDLPGFTLAADERASLERALAAAQSSGSS